MWVYVIQSRSTGIEPSYAIYLSQQYHWAGHSSDAWEFASPQEAKAKAETLGLFNYQIVAMEV